jgi:hypothetical protein
MGPSPSSLRGCCWKHHLEFYDYDEQPKPEVVLLRSFDLTKLPKYDYKYIFPNSKQQVVEIKRYIHPLNINQTSWNFFHHAYIVMRTGLDEWSFEKNQEGLVVQRGTKFKCCVEYLHGNQRSRIYNYSQRATFVNSGVTVQDLLEWIVDNGELDKPYDVLSDNCQYFADRIMKAIVEFKRLNTTN